MQKAYVRINWENYPSESTPINESNLNRMDYAINEIDDRVIVLDATKLNISDANVMIKGWDLNSETGVITITYYNNSTSIINTNLNKIAVNFTYDRTTQSLVLTLPDGSTTRVPLSDLIQDNDFQDTDTVAFTVVNGIVTANIKLGSITGEHLRTDYLADIMVAEANAAASEASADASAVRSQSWAVGGTNTRQGEDTDNSMYYSQLSDSSRQAAEVARADAENLVAAATSRLTNLTVQVSLSDGHLYYDAPTGLVLQVNNETGALMYDVTTV